jgi:hypothetical protein
VLAGDDRAAVEELAPVLRRAAGLDPRSLARLRLDGVSATVLVRLPFGVLVSRTVDAPDRDESLDVTMRAAEVVSWLDADPAAAVAPIARDLEWRAGLPPRSGWKRLEKLPDDVIRGLVRTGALALKDAAARAGVPGAQPRAEVADALLDSVVLTATDEAGTSAHLTLRAVSALTRMGFLPRGGHAYVDVAGRWVRLVGEYGTVYLERPGQALGIV